MRFSEVLITSHTMRFLEQFTCNISVVFRAIAVRNKIKNNLENDPSVFYQPVK